MKSFLRLMFTFGLALTSCQTEPTPTPSPLIFTLTNHVQDTPQPAEETQPAFFTPEADPATPATESVIRAVQKDLSLRLNIPREQILITSIERITWPDSSLGCPLPDMVYARGTVAGYRIRLEAGGTEYVYHTDQKNKFVLCMVDGQLVLTVTPDNIRNGQP